MKEFLNKNKYILLLIIFSFLLMIPFIQEKTVLLDDKHFHLLRIEGIVEGFLNGNFFPRISSNMIYGYGYGTPLFYPDIFLYIPAFLTYIGFNIYTSYDIFLFIINITTALIAYYAFKQISNSKKQAFYYSFMYLYFPYRLFNFYIRNALGEILAMIIFPLLLLFIYDFIKKNKCNYFLLAITFTLLLNSHLISLYVCFFTLLIVCILNIKKILTNKYLIINFLKGILLTIGINAYFLFPLIEQQLSQKFRYNQGSTQGELIENAYLITNGNFFVNMVFLTIICIGVYVFLKFTNIYKSKTIIVLTIISVTSILLTTNVIPWAYLSKIPLISNIQFPWRLFMLSCVVIPYLFIEIGVFLKDNKRFNEKLITELKRVIIVFFSILAIFLVFILSHAVHPHKNLTLYSNGYSGGEYLPANFNGLHIIQDTYFCGNEEKEYDFKKEKNKYIVNSNKEVIEKNIEVPLIYYKGYVAYNKENDFINIKENNGLINLEIDSETSDVITIEYRNTNVQKISYSISLIFIIFSIIFIKRKGLN